METKKSWQAAASGGLYKDGYPVSGIWAFEYTGLSSIDGSPEFNLEGLNDLLADTDATVYMKYAGKLDPDFT